MSDEAYMLAAKNADSCDPLLRLALADIYEEQGRQEEADRERCHARLHDMMNRFVGGYTFPSEEIEKRT